MSKLKSGTYCIDMMPDGTFRFYDPVNYSQTISYFDDLREPFLMLDNKYDVKEVTVYFSIKEKK